MKKSFYRISNIILGEENTKARDFALLLLRLAVGVFMLTHAWQKLSNFETLKTVFPDPLGVGSMLSLILILFAELGCSLLIIFGFFTRLAVIPAMFGMIIAAFVIHGGDAFAAKELSLLYLSMYVVLAFTGAGKYSIDFLLRSWLTKYKP